jgi:hypothetical protein
MKKIKLTRTKILNALSVLLVATIITSCGKDGDIGPKGDTGATGAPGAAGSQGIPGKDGALILSGTVAPGTSTGNNGDMYLDKSANNLYGPKTASGWGLALSLKGDNGQTGASGSVILNGTGVPTMQGNNGDYFLNKTNADLYGPKTASGWGTPINLRGTANVVGSTLMNLKPWNNNGINYYREAEYEIPNPVLNAVGYTSLGNMLEKGGVLLVYFYRGGFIFPVPVNIQFTGEDYELSWYYYRFGNSFYFNVHGFNNTPIPTDLLMTPGIERYKIRYVLIPAGTQITTTANLKNMTFDQVKELLKLKD